MGISKMSDYQIKLIQNNTGKICNISLFNRGFGFVEFVSQEEAKNAFKNL
jgi:RNA recognition motif-containing protein